MGVILQDQIALVTGASRGIGRGIALQLGEAGATVYITGRRPELSENFGLGLPSLEYVAKEITNRGGKGIALYVDHSNMTEVKFLFEKIKEDQDGRLDILVNNVYDSLGVSVQLKISLCLIISFKKATEIVGNVLGFYQRCWIESRHLFRNHYYCSVYASRMMVEKRKGLIVNVGSLGGLKYVFNVAYGAGKEALSRMSTDMAVELNPYNVCVVTLIPGPVKTETSVRKTIDENYKITEKVPVHARILANLEDQFQNSEEFVKGESTEYTGKALARLAMDPGRQKKTGKTLFTEDLAQKYDFTDKEGSCVVDPKILDITHSGMEPQNIRSVRTILGTMGKSEIAKYISPKIKLPKWVIWQSVNRF
uniref:Dehydrogenase/reductase SDR family member 1 n=1 Tax=Caenorhabditis tropicalis TaxID=1561998 RepID=A0A1I7UK95_9PELO